MNFTTAEEDGGGGGEMVIRRRHSSRPDFGGETDVYEFCKEKSEANVI